MGEIKAVNVDVIIITGYYPEAALIAKQARQFGIKAALAGGDGWDGSSLIPVGGRVAEGAYFSDHFAVSDTSPLVQSFVAAYKKKYSSAPDAFAALGYDAFKLLVDAIKRAGGTDPEKLRAAIPSTKGFPAVSRKIPINPERTATNSSALLT